MNNARLFPALLLGSTLFGGLAFGTTAHPAAAGGGIPPVINCLQHVCTLLQDDATDSDGDGYTDADEKAFGSDPSDPRSTPPIRWIFASIADETLPGVWLEPQIDLLTISPDGHAITIDIEVAMGSLGLPLPKRAGDFDPAAMSPAGIDLGTLGVTLDWQVHGVATSTSQLPPDAPDASLYGLTGATPPEFIVKRDDGEIRVKNTFSFGTFTSEVHIHNSDGKLMGSGIASSSDPWQAQTEATKKAAAGATPERAKELVTQVTDEAKRLADALPHDQEAPTTEAPQHGKEQKDHGLFDPDATPIDPKFLTPEQVEAAIAAGNGSYWTNVGNTGILALVTATEYVDPTIFIIHINPDADPMVTNDTPDIGGHAGPDHDPNLPQGGTITGGTLPPSGTNS